MINRRKLAIARLIAVMSGITVLAGLAVPAWCQGLDAGPATPDPLAPVEVDKPAPAAPGAPVLPIPAKPADTVHPIVALVRERLAAMPSRGSEADKEDYAGLVAFYAESNGQPVWTSKDGFTARATQVLAELRRADDWGLKASAFDVPSLPDGQASDEVLADAEIKLGLAALKYGRYARGGRLDPPSISRMFDQKPVIYDPKSLLQALAVTDDIDTADAYLRNLHPKHPQFARLRQAMLAARGARADETPSIIKIPAGPTIKPGQEHPHIALLRQRLAIPAASEANETLYDDALVTAVKAVQVQSGLDQTGVINTATRNALNGAERPSSGGNLQRIIVNMERWRWMPDELGDIYVWDSVPEQMTSVYAQGKQVLAEKIVVGKPSSPTPIFSADMQFIIFHPSWGVPAGIKAYELAPLLRNAGGGWFFSSGASAVLRGYGLHVSRGGRPVDPDSINWSNVDVQSFDFTQPPGPTNVLGIVKFRFPNKHDVYMHDTPERHLFNGAIRAFSHGCMRVQNPIKLAEVLLAHDKGWSSDQVQEYVRRGGEIKLTTPIPVHVTYFTAVVDDAGNIHFRPDIYGLDSRVASRLEGQAVHLATASVERPEAMEKSDLPGRAKARPRQKAASSQSYNPFAAIFGN
ncbi:MAG: L,D-transpeptidase family protein [Hyphomicrobiaceae bacterium]|nr:L,D-transpeptidase family protein [Hyphomicrobiaceae bacterium]